MVHQVHRAGNPLPISGIGGIQDATDIVEFLLAGASTVQIGTQNFIDPDCAGRLVGDLRVAAQAQGVTDIRELIGALKIG
jgi:dihydroorotate dehydrogenase (NAD+) catalytic subunit